MQFFMITSFQRGSLFFFFIGLTSDYNYKFDYIKYIHLYKLSNFLQQIYARVDLFLLYI